jgi:hypothetical protein
VNTGRHPTPDAAEARHTEDDGATAPTCAQDADGLIEEISTALAVGIGEHRSRLAAAWQDGRPDVEELEKSLRDRPRTPGAGPAAGADSARRWTL